MVLRRGLTAHRKTGAVVGVPHFLTLLAELFSLSGQVEEGLLAANEALELTLETGNRYLEPDIHRVRGDLLTRLPHDGSPPGLDVPYVAADAEGSLRRAVELARRRSAKSLELRAATRLGWLWHERGESARARRLLGPLCGWFTEGNDTADVSAARQLVAVLTPPRKLRPAPAPSRRPPSRRCARMPSRAPGLTMRPS